MGTTELKDAALLHFRLQKCVFSDFACLNVFLICIKKCLNENSAAYVMTCGDEVDAVDLSMKSK